MMRVQSTQYSGIANLTALWIAKILWAIASHDIWQKLARCGLPLLGVIALQGCLKEETVAVSITGYNHIETESILAFSVNEASGPNLAPYSGGSGFSCCISLPLHWKPGLKATVHWQYGSGPNHTPPPPQSATVEIPEYSPEGMGTLQVHFYPRQRIKVVSSKYQLGAADHPLPKEDWAPWTLNEAWVRNQEWLKQQKAKKERTSND